MNQYLVTSGDSSHDHIIGTIEEERAREERARREQLEQNSRATVQIVVRVHKVSGTSLSDVSVTREDFHEHDNWLFDHLSTLVPFKQWRTVSVTKANIQSPHATFEDFQQLCLFERKMRDDDYMDQLRSASHITLDTRIFYDEIMPRNSMIKAVAKKQYDLYMKMIKPCVKDAMSSLLIRDILCMNDNYDERPADFKWIFDIHLYEEEERAREERAREERAREERAREEKVQVTILLKDLPFTSFHHNEVFFTRNDFYRNSNCLFDHLNNLVPFTKWRTVKVNKKNCDSPESGTEDFPEMCVFERTATDRLHESNQLDLYTTTKIKLESLLRQHILSMDDDHPHIHFEWIFDIEYYGD
jgi:hypothetical protein